MDSVCRKLAVRPGPGDGAALVDAGADSCGRSFRLDETVAPAVSM